VLINGTGYEFWYKCSLLVEIFIWFFILYRYNRHTQSVSLCFMARPIAFNNVTVMSYNIILDASDIKNEDLFQFHIL
jgi:hypothetical protein